MKFAIIAAGEGSRLAQEGVNVSKPMVCLNGEPMIDRLIRIFRTAGAEEICLIVNERMDDVKSHVADLQKKAADTDCPLRVVVKSTPSSMHSFFELSSLLGSAPFCLTTVDTIFREADFLAYIRAFSESDCDGMMAVTDFIDDEKPLYIATDETLKITGFFDEPHDCKYISGGIYCLTSPAIDCLKRCMNEGVSRMRNFQRRLVADGLSLRAYPFPKILDVDHASDIRKAEQFIKGEE